MLAFNLLNSDYKPSYIIGIGLPPFEGATDFSQNSCPVLAIYGDKDQEVNANESLEKLTNLFPDAQTVVFPGLNHLMQHALTGSPDEYNKIEETFAPEVLSEIGRFIQKQR